MERKLIRWTWYAFMALCIGLLLAPLLQVS